MSEKLFADLTLPSGRANALTPARRAVLARLGAALLKGGVLYTYGAISSLGLRHCLGGRIKDAKERGALLGMRKAGWLRVIGTPSAYTRTSVELIEPWASVAKRLAGVEALRQERIEQRLQPLQKREQVARSASWDLGRQWERACPTNRYGEQSVHLVTTTEVLALYDRCMKAGQELAAATLALEETKAVAEATPAPTDDEVLVWLVKRALTK